MSNNNKSHANCGRCKLPFFNVEGHAMCFRCREDGAINTLQKKPRDAGAEAVSLHMAYRQNGAMGAELVRPCMACGHAELYHCGADDCPQPRGSVEWIGGHPRGVGCETNAETERRLALENVPAVDHETNQRCSFCQKQILGIRIVITKAGTTWIQVAAGAWIGVNPLDGNQLEVRCAGCLLPEV